jgi:phosphoribosylglycinamide formyltransferase-1
MIKIGVLLSGTGRTLLNLLEHIQAGKLDVKIACVLSDREGVQGLRHAENASIPTFVEPDSQRSFEALRAHQVDLVCLCGYLSLLEIPTDFHNRVLNIHPSLLPKYGGHGFYGHHVHEAVLAAGEVESGCTVHYCNDQYDRGDVLLQKSVLVKPGDDADRLAARIFHAECAAYPEAIQLWKRRHP